MNTIMKLNFHLGIITLFAGFGMIIAGIPLAIISGFEFGIVAAAMGLGSLVLGRIFLWTATRMGLLFNRNYGFNLNNIEAEDLETLIDEGVVVAASFLLRR